MAKSRKDMLKIYKIISAVAVVVAVVALVLPNFSKVDVVMHLLPIEELSIQEYTKVDVQVSASGNIGVVALEGNCYQLTATTDLSQIESIANGQEGKIEARPKTHDLFKDTLDVFDINVVMVKIVDIQNDTYIGKLILKQGEKIVSLDSRPSDGIAVAVRTGAPVYINDNLLKAKGKYIC